ncbi:O-antigen/teichoic acid export membrane protein [Bradyrhizobium sp. LM2.7]
MAFSALSRLQDDPVRFRNYFLKGYTLVNSLTIPITVFSAIFAYDIIAACLGQKWTDAALIFRLLSPTVMTFGIINPMVWLLLSLGLYARSFRISLVICPLVILSYVIGLPFGPTGVALAYSSAMLLWLAPHILWCVHGTPISAKDIIRAVSRPLFCALLAGCISLSLHYYGAQLPTPLLRVSMGACVFGAAYISLLFVVGEGRLYLELFRGLRMSTSSDGT